jgi:hypothetical protein
MTTFTRVPTGSTLVTFPIGTPRMSTSEFSNRPMVFVKYAVIW